MKLEKYLNEDLKQTYFNVALKDFEVIKNATKAMEIDFKKKDIVGIRSAARSLESSAKRVIENLGRIKE